MMVKVTPLRHASKIDPRLPDASFLRLTKEISKTQASTIFQLRLEHTPLRKYLFRIGKLDSPACVLCHHGAESVHHFLFECPTHQHARFNLSRALGCQSKSLRYLLGNKKSLKPLLHFVNNTGCFHDIPNLPQHSGGRADTR